MRLPRRSWASDRAEFPVQRQVANAQSRAGGRRCSESGLSPCSIDGFDPRPRPARTLGDLAILRFNEMACRRVPVQAAQHGAGYLAVGRDCPVLVDDVEQHELNPRVRLSAAHRLVPPCTAYWSGGVRPSDGHAVRKLALLGHALESFALTLDSVKSISILDGKQPNDLVLSARGGHAGTGRNEVHQLTYLEFVVRQICLHVMRLRPDASCGSRRGQRKPPVDRLRFAE